MQGREAGSRIFLRIVLARRYIGPVSVE